MERLTKIAAGLRAWFQGKKTLLGGGLLIVVGVLGVGLGKVGAMDGAQLVGFGVAICGFSAKAERHQSQVLTALQAVATAGVDLRLGNKAGALAAVEPVIVQGVQSIDYEGYARARQNPPTGGNS